jgi:glycine oxidase
MARQPLKVAIAGAGVFGLASALSLARAGASVLVIDPAPLGDNASGVAAGMLAPAFECLSDPLARPHAADLKEARDFWPDFASASGVRLDRRGALAPAEDAEALAAELAELGFAAQVLTAAEAKAMAPGLDDGVGTALFTGEDWRLDAPDALIRLREAAEAEGVRFEKDVVRDYRDGRALTRGGRRHAVDRLVVATGAAMGLTDLAFELRKLTPIKGQIVRTDLAYEGPVLRGEGVYVAPGVGGALIGATMEVGLADRDIDGEQVRRLVGFGAELLPALAGAKLTPSAGVRAGAADGLPLVGKGEFAGVILAVGARRNGWLLAPLVAEAVTAYAYGRPAPAAALSFDPARPGL